MPPADATGQRRRHRRGRGRWWRWPAAAITSFALLVGCSAAPTQDPEAPETRQSTDEPGRLGLRPPPADRDTAEPPGLDPEPTPEPAPQPAQEPAPPPPPPPPPPGRDALVAEVERLLGRAVSEAETGDLAVLVVDEYGRELAAHGPDEALLPASTLKVVTAAAILTTLGPRYRISTTVEATAPIDGEGRLRGQLVLTGAGDPVLSTPEYSRWVYPARPRTPLEELADQLVTAGLQELDGDVLAVAPGFDGPRVPDGWPDRYFSSFDARYSDGLTVDAGLRTILTYPDPDDEDGDADGQASTDDDVGDSGSDGEGADGDGSDEDDEVDPEDLGPPDVRVDHAAEPALHAAAELIRLLDERGVDVRGQPVVAEPDGLIVGRLAAVESPPMFDLLRFAMQRSDNQVTDGLFRLAGRVRTGEGSFAAGDRALRQVLDRFDIDHSQAVFADGSGLSRDDRATARLLVELDVAMTASRHGEAWQAIMAAMGESGTLERRLRGTPAHGRFIGKTGTLRDVTALSGAVLDADGTRYHLAVLANDAGATRGVARALADELILLLVADLDGCSIDRPGDTDGPLGVPPLVVQC